jgi:ParB family transcriptional regulator, chromosome partitioning protein
VVMTLAIEAQRRDAAAVTVTGALLLIPIDDVHPGPNARGDVGDVTALQGSIIEEGQLQPIIVEPRAEGGFQIRDGHRRRKAMKEAGFSSIAGVLRRTLDPCDRIVQQLAMHTARENFNPMAESNAIHELYWQHRLDLAEIAGRIGRTQAWARDRLALRNLNSAEQEALANNRLSVADALLIVRGRRLERDGRLLPDAPSARPQRPRKDTHFTTDHPQAQIARGRCTNEHRVKKGLLGGVACGECWETAIREDQERKLSPR